MVSKHTATARALLGQPTECHNKDTRTAGGDAGADVYYEDQHHRPGLRREVECNICRPDFVDRLGLRKHYSGGNRVRTAGWLSAPSRVYRLVCRTIVVFLSSRGRCSAIPPANEEAYPRCRCQRDSSRENSAANRDRFARYQFVYITSPPISVAISSSSAPLPPQTLTSMHVVKLPSHPTRSSLRKERATESLSESGCRPTPTHASRP